MLQQVDLKTVGYAVDWKFEDIGRSRILLTYPTCLGSMIFDQARQIVMVFDTQGPSETEIARNLMSCLRYPSNQPIVERLLDAENSVLFNMAANGLRFDTPYGVFPFTTEEGKALAVVECNFKDWGGCSRRNWTVFNDEAKLQAYKAAIALLEKAVTDGNALDEKRARNKLQYLTGHPYGKWFVVYELYSEFQGWQNKSTIDISGIDQMNLENFDFVHCFDCGFDEAVMYCDYNPGNRMAVLESAWLEHKRKHRDCVGNFVL